jgi:peptide/nickel transport system permease protein
MPVLNRAPSAGDPGAGGGEPPEEPAVVDEPAEHAPARRRRGGFGLWIAKRIGSGLLVLFAVSLLVFTATQALPSDPAEQILGRQATPERVDRLNEQLHLNDPLPQQYVDWLGRIVRGDFGTSLSTRESVGSILGTAALNSLLLLVIVAAIAIPFSILLGVVAAARRDSAFDGLATGAALFATAVPEFVIALILVIVFGTTLLTIFPPVALVPPGQTPLDHPDILILPVATLVIVVVPWLFRLVRGSMIEALSSEYVAYARLRGIPEKEILRRHALRNALVPTAQASALTLGYLLGGIVVVEFVFNYPGLGSELTTAVDVRDLPVIQAVVLVLTAGVIVFNLIADALTVLLTPRLRTTLGR